MYPMNGKTPTPKERFTNINIPNNNGEETKSSHNQAEEKSGIDSSLLFQVDHDKSALNNQINLLQQNIANAHIPYNDNQINTFTKQIETTIIMFHKVQMLIVINY